MHEPLLVLLAVAANLAAATPIQTASSYDFLAADQDWQTLAEALGQACFGATRRGPSSFGMTQLGHDAPGGHAEQSSPPYH